jgi:hypothetical protein
MILRGFYCKAAAKLGSYKAIAEYQLLFSQWNEIIFS